MPPDFFRLVPYRELYGREDKRKMIADYLFELPQGDVKVKDMLMVGGSVKLTLGITEDGDAEYLLPSRLPQALVSHIHLLKQAYTNRYISLSPITFHTKEDLKKKLTGSVKSSKAHRLSKLGDAAGLASEADSTNAERSAAFEHARVFWRFIDRNMRSEVYPRLIQAPLPDPPRIVVVAFNFWSPKMYRAWRDDTDIFEDFAWGEIRDRQLTDVEHFNLNPVLSTPWHRKTDFQGGTTQVIDTAACSIKFQAFLDRPRSGPLFIICHEKAKLATAFKALKLDPATMTDKWCTLKDLLVFEPPRFKREGSRDQAYDQRLRYSSEVRQSYTRESQSSHRQDGGFYGGGDDYDGRRSGSANGYKRGSSDYNEPRGPRRPSGSPPIKVEPDDDYSRDMRNSPFSNRAGSSAPYSERGMSQMSDYSYASFGPSRGSSASVEKELHYTDFESNRGDSPSASRGEREHSYMSDASYASFGPSPYREGSSASVERALSHTSDTGYSSPGYQHAGSSASVERALSMTSDTSYTSYHPNRRTPLFRPDTASLAPYREASIPQPPPPDDRTCVIETNLLYNVMHNFWAEQKNVPEVARDLGISLGLPAEVEDLRCAGHEVQKIWLTLRKLLEGQPVHDRWDEIQTEWRTVKVEVQEHVIPAPAPQPSSRGLFASAAAPVQATPKLVYEDFSDEDSQ